MKLNSMSRCLLFTVFLSAPVLITAHNYRITCYNPNEDPSNIDTRGVLNWQGNNDHGGRCILPQPDPHHRHRPHYPSSQSSL